MFKCKCCGEKKQDGEESYDNISFCRDCGGEMAICVNCNNEFICSTDLILCESCINNFDLERLWKLHDLNKLDALDFNENNKLRDSFRVVV